MTEQGELLRQAVYHSQIHAEGLDAVSFPLQAFHQLQAFQRERIAITYADLLQEKEFQRAGHFFLEELYGGLGFRERDREVERALPVMVRVLPDAVLATVTRAFELQTLSLTLDMRMAELLADRAQPVIDAALYGELYRACGCAPERDEQIVLIVNLGVDLNALVRHRMMLGMLRALRLPAKAAGFGQLQAFLERGMGAFRSMNRGQVFVDTIGEREEKIREQLLAGIPEPLLLQPQL